MIFLNPKFLDSTVLGPRSPPEAAAAAVVSERCPTTCSTACAAAERAVTVRLMSWTQTVSLPTAYGNRFVLQLSFKSKKPQYSDELLNLQAIFRCLSQSAIYSQSNETGFDQRGKFRVVITKSPSGQSYGEGYSLATS